jgi:transposase
VKFFAGVDTHRDTHSIAIINELGELVDSFSITADTVGFEQAISKTATFPELAWGLEGTGSYGRTFAETLVRVGYTVYEVPGMISKRHRNRLRHRGKSDAQDARAIAESVLRERDSLTRCVDADQEEATRLLYERRDRKIRERTEKTNRFRALGLRAQLKLPADMTTSRSLKLAAEVVERIEPHGFAGLELVDELRDLLAELRHIESTVSTLEKRLRPFVERLAPRLLEIKGCSIVSAAGLIGHAGEMSGYRDSSAFASHAGVAPVQCSSGKHQAVRLNTGGNRQLNRCLHTLANVQMRTAGHVGKAYYDRKRSEGKTHREAMRCLKRQLANVIFRLLVEAAARRSESTSLAKVA